MQSTQEETQETAPPEPKTTRRTLWQTPAIHQEEDQQLHRKVSWLELFYDLVFVAVIAQISHYLAGHMTWEGLAGYALLFVPVWWVWIAGTYYNERFETFGLETASSPSYRCCPSPRWPCSRTMLWATPAASLPLRTRPLAPSTYSSGRGPDTTYHKRGP